MVGSGADVAVDADIAVGGGGEHCVGTEGELIANGLVCRGGDDAIVRMVLPPRTVLRLLAYKAPLIVVLPVLLSCVSPRRAASLPTVCMKVMSPEPVAMLKV